MLCNRQQHVDRSRPLTCLTRRGAMKVSVGTALGALLGPTLPRAFTQADSLPVGNDKSVILIWLEGGPFQHESFDPKTTTDEDLAYRIKPISTTADGVQLAACMPHLAQQAHHLAIIRSMVGAEMQHNQAQYHMQTGWRSTGPIQAPAIGSIVAHEMDAIPMFRADPDGLPSYVSIGRAGFPPGYFGAAYKPTIVWDPNQPPENLGLPGGVNEETFARRLELLQLLEQGKPLDRPAQHFHSGREGAISLISTGRYWERLVMRPSTRRSASSR